MAKRAVFVVPHQAFRSEELELPLRALRKAKVEVELVSSSLGPARAMSGETVEVDRLYSAVDPSDLDALVFVGGHGASEFFDDRTAHRLAQEAVKLGKLVGAICYAPSILANAGLLEGQSATAHPERRLHLEARGATYADQSVVTTRALLTARGPEDAPAFADALVAALA